MNPPACYGLYCAASRNSFCSVCADYFLAEALLAQAHPNRVRDEFLGQLTRYRVFAGVYGSVRIEAFRTASKTNLHSVESQENWIASFRDWLWVRRFSDRGMSRGSGPRRRLHGY